VLSSSIPHSIGAIVHTYAGTIGKSSAPFVYIELTAGKNIAVNGRIPSTGASLGSSSSSSSSNAKKGAKKWPVIKLTGRRLLRRLRVGDVECV
jgi:hypothetical protein